MRFDPIVSIHMISQGDGSHESLGNIVRPLYNVYYQSLTLPQISHLNGRFSASS